MTTPLVDVIANAYPQATITYMVGAWSKVVAEHHPAIDNVIDSGTVGIAGRYTLNDYRKIIKEVRKQHFDMAFVLDRSPLMTLLPALAGIPRRIGPDSLGRGFSLTDRVPISSSPTSLQHQADIYLNLARFINLPLDSPRMRFVPTEEERQSVIRSSHLQVALLAGGGSNPGMQLTAKRWPLENYQALTQKLVRELDAQVLLVGGPDEVAFNQSLLADLDVPPDSVINLAGKTTIGELAAQLETCALFIGNDSSPMHLAAAVGIPVIAIFGPTSPQEYGPYPLNDPNHISIWRHSSGQPCFFLGKMQTSEECTCIQAVTLADVWKEVLRLIPHPQHPEVHQQGDGKQERAMASIALVLRTLIRPLLRSLMLLLVRLYGFPLAFRASLKARKPVSTTPRILLIRPDHLGDLVLTTPVLHALHERIPAASLTFMVGPWSSMVVARHPDLDRLILCPFPGFQRVPQRPLAPYILLFKTARQLRRGNYDLAINLRPDFWWGAALLYPAGIPRRIGYAIKPGTPFLTQALSFEQPELATLSNLRLVSAALEVLGYPPLEKPYIPEKYPSVFTPTAEEQLWVTERLGGEGIDADTPFVVIHPGTGAPVKLWRTEAWANCANTLLTLLKALTGPRTARIILTGSPNEQPMLEEIAASMTNPPVLLTDATVGQLAALLQRAILVVGVDNGPLHLAVAQQTPTIQLFGPTDPKIFGPWGSAEQHIVIASTHRCPTCPAIPCNRLDFRPAELPAHPCVRRIPEHQVLNAVEAMIKQQVWR